MDIGHRILNNITFDRPISLPFLFLQLRIIKEHRPFGQFGGKSCRWGGVRITTQHIYAKQDSIELTDVLYPEATIFHKRIGMKVNQNNVTSSEYWLSLFIHGKISSGAWTLSCTSILQPVAVQTSGSQRRTD